MKYSNPEIESSYRVNDLGQTLYDVVLDLKPKKIIEFGVLNGYSTVAMGMALNKLGTGKIKAYDLFEKYPYKHSTKKEVMHNLRNYDVDKYVELESGDYMEIEPEPFDLLHIDVSNTGTILREIITKWAPFGGRIIFEGGSYERDNVDWMIQFQKEPIQWCGIDYEVLNDAFPGISIVKI